MRVKFSSKAHQEGVDARRWYRRRSIEAAQDFDAELRAAVGRIRSNPLQYQVQDEAGNRSAWLHRFPYKVIYRIGAGQVLVVAVSHGSRDPEYWRKR